MLGQLKFRRWHDLLSFVQLLINFILVGTFIFSGFNSFGSPIAPYDVLKIKITHSHEHDHDHHHHGEDTELPKHGHQKSEVPNPQHTGDSNHSDQHSHELVICSAHTVFTEAKSALPTAFEFVNIYPDSKDAMPPSDRSLESIFRPPIFA